MKIYIIIVLIVLILLLLFYLDHDTYTSWSNNWTKLDFKARENANCKPIKKEYKKLGEMNSWIWTMNDSCENGLPHTRANDIIALPEKLSERELNKIIEHEKIHLQQRRYPTIWKEFYKKYWDYEIYKLPPIAIPSELTEMIRANPDTNDAPYACWKNKWWSIPIYKSHNDLKFINCIVKWWNQETNEIFNNPPDEWVSFFGFNVSQSEHPHEISAVYIADILFKNYNDSIIGMKILNQHLTFLTSM
jgi:hypothetical protein